MDRDGEVAAEAGQIARTGADPIQGRIEILDLAAEGAAAGTRDVVVIGQRGVDLDGRADGQAVDDGHVSLITSRAVGGQVDGAAAVIRQDAGVVIIRFAGPEPIRAGRRAQHVSERTAGTALELDLVGDVEEAVHGEVAAGQPCQGRLSRTGQAQVGTGGDDQFAKIRIAVKLSLQAEQVLIEGLERIAGSAGGGVDLAVDRDGEVAAEAGQIARTGADPIQGRIEILDLAAEGAAAGTRDVVVIGQRGVDLDGRADGQAVDDGHVALVSIGALRGKIDGTTAVIRQDTGLGESERGGA